MGGVNKFTTRLNFVSSFLRIHSNCRLFAGAPSSTPPYFYRLLSTSDTLRPRTLLTLAKCSSRTYSSFEDDTSRNRSIYSDSDDYPVIRQPKRYRNDTETRWKGSGSRRPSSFSQRPYRTRDFDSSYNRRYPESRTFDEDEDYYSDTFDHRFQSQQRLGANIPERDWNASTLSSIEKNFYVVHPDVAERSSEVIDNYYNNHNITVSQGERPVPLSDFHEANFPEKIVRYLENNSWSSPTPIQSLGWPIALSGKNMVGLAQTGSGKTLGFILPALVHIKHQRPVDRNEGPIVLVLAPTRELVQQIKGVAVEYGSLLGMRSCSVFGGQSKMVQARQLRQGPELVVATPGRLLDFIESQVIDLGRTTYLVLDEADRMLDMGFEPQIRKVLGQIRPDRQTLMWSATWPKEIQLLAHDFLGDFTQINIGSQELTANPNIEQVVRVCEWREKFGLLLDELKKQCSASEDKKIPKTLIFCQTKMAVDILSKKLWNRRVKVEAIHGDKSQLHRDTALKRFRDRRVDVLVATDVAARGLDVDDIKVVINYDFPNNISDYIHRIGRTGRATKTGTAISFVTDNDASKVNDIISTLKSTGQNVDPELYDLARLHSMFSKKSSKSRSSFRPRSPPKFNKNRHRSGFHSWND